MSAGDDGIFHVGYGLCSGKEVGDATYISHGYGYVEADQLGVGGCLLWDKEGHGGEGYPYRTTASYRCRQGRTF